jgi:histidinol-phosphate/aromatic aminotransferase/cobyric acid decarboxylase-like protein
MIVLKFETKGAGRRAMTSLDCKDGITTRLNLLEPTIPAYSEPHMTGFQEPAFVVIISGSELAREVGRRYKRSLFFKILYYPDPSNLEKQEECHEMAERLFEHMEQIVVNGSLCRISEMKHEIVDNVLHFSLSFHMYVVRAELEELKMQTMEQGGKLKNV